jgi:Rieske Fe-S protein
MRPCAHVPGDRGDPTRCPHLTGHRSGLCDLHRSLMHQQIDANRPSPSARGYDRTHRADRRRAVAAGQTCQHPGCQRTDIHRDHIDGNPRNNRTDNIAWLCQSHHSAKTLTHDVERDSAGRIQRKNRRTNEPKRPTIRSVGM